MSTGLSTEPFLFAELVILALAIVSAVAAAWFARRTNVRELRNDVDSILDVIEKIDRANRREQMRRVRAAANDVPAVPPELRAAPEPPVFSKNDLRRIAAGRHQ